MATKLEYLKLCIQNLKPIEYKSWYYYMFTTLFPKDEPIDTKNLYDPVLKVDGLYYLDINEQNEKTLVKIEDYKKDDPLFRFSDIVTADSMWLPSIEGKIETKVGVLIVNALCLYPALKKKIPYLNEPISVPKIEKFIYQKLEDDDKATEDQISVSEMVECFNRLTFLSNLAPIVNIASSEKIITKPPGIDEIRKKLFEEYKDQLTDPVKVVELEKKLEQIDKEYLKDDFAASKLINRKSQVARKASYLMLGQQLDFVEQNDATPILTSLSEGLPLDEEEFSKLQNSSRVGSWYRGSRTALGGYSAKTLAKSLGSLTISRTPCDTTKGITRLIKDSNYKMLINRYVKEGNKWVLVDSEAKAKSFIGKEVEIRSLMYCKSPGNTVCYACMSEYYKQASEQSIYTLAYNLSAVLLTMQLKLMHGTVSENCKINLQDLIN